MATLEAPSTSKGRSWLDCGQCGELCVGATILRCGHVYCRSCVIHLVQTSAPCPACGQTVSAPPGATLSQRVQAMSQELVLQDLVVQRLATQGPCDTCRNPRATSHCLDCRERYCVICSSSHRKMKMAADHEIRALPPVPSNSPGGARAETTTGAAGSAPRTDSSASTGKDTDPVAKRRRLSEVGQSEDVKNWSAAKMELLTRTMSRLDDMEQQARAQVERVMEKKDFLRVYMDRLGHVDVTEGSDCLRYLTGLSRDQVMVGVDLRDFERRLDDITEKMTDCDGRACWNPLRVSSQQVLDPTAVDDHDSKPPSVEWEVNPSAVPDHDSHPPGFARVGSTTAVPDHDSNPPGVARVVNPTAVTDHKSNPPDISRVGSATAVFDYDSKPPNVVWVWDTTGVSDQDSGSPNIVDILPAQDGRLMLSDHTNKMIKVTSMSAGSHITCVRLREKPLYFAALSDGLVALTAEKKTLLLLDVSEGVNVQSRVKTAKQYACVEEGPDDDTLLVSTCVRYNNTIHVEVVNRDGTRLKSLVDSMTLGGLKEPSGMCVFNGYLVISDLQSDCVYRVEVATGRLVDTLTHPDLVSPSQVVADSQGNLYVSSTDAQRVLVLTPRGRWISLLNGHQHSDRDHTYPLSLCVTKTGIVVEWWTGKKMVAKNARVIIGYEFM